MVILVHLLKKQLRTLEYCKCSSLCNIDKYLDALSPPNSVFKLSHLKSLGKTKTKTKGLDNWGYVESVKLEELKCMVSELISLETLCFHRKCRGPAGGAGVCPPRGKDVQPHGSAGRGVPGVFPLHGGPVCGGGTEGRPSRLPPQVLLFAALDHRPSGSVTHGAWWSSLVAAALRVQQPCRVAERAIQRCRGWRRGLWAPAATVRPFLAPAQTLGLFCLVSWVMREMKYYPSPRAGDRKRS